MLTLGDFANLPNIPPDAVGGLPIRAAEPKDELGLDDTDLDLSAPGPLDIPGPLDAPMPPMMGPVSAFPLGTRVRDVLSGQEGEVVESPPGDYGDIVFVKSDADGLTHPVNKEFLESASPAPVAAPTPLGGPATGAPAFIPSSESTGAEGAPLVEKLGEAAPALTPARAPEKKSKITAAGYKPKSRLAAKKIKADTGMGEHDSEDIDGMDVRIYDNGGETVDRYTIIIENPETGEQSWLGSSAEPFHPQGYGQHVGDEGTGNQEGEHLGKRVYFKDLPAQVQKFVKQDIHWDEKVEDPANNPKDVSEMQPSSLKNRKPAIIADLVTAKADPRKISYRVFASKLKAIKAPTHADALDLIGYVPGNWDLLVGRLMKDGILLKSKKASFDVAEFKRKGFKDSEIRLMLARQGVPLYALAKAFTVLAEKPTLPKPTTAPKAGHVWTWDSEKQAYYEAPAAV